MSKDNESVWGGTDKAIRAHLEAVIETLKSELEKTRWIPVTERLPELEGDETQSLWVHVTDGRLVEKAYYYDYTKRETKPNQSTGKGWYVHGIAQKDITHWQLIDLPGEDDE